MGPPQPIPTTPSIGEYHRAKRKMDRAPAGQTPPQRTSAPERSTIRMKLKMMNEGELRVRCFSDNVRWKAKKEEKGGITWIAFYILYILHGGGVEIDRERRNPPI